jgi:hypothetical protein
MDLGAALLALIVAFVVKVPVMALSAWLLWSVERGRRLKDRERLWLLLPDAPLPELPALRAGLVLFALSELTCGIEVYVLARSSALISGAHSILSAAGMAAFSLGALRWADARLLRWGQPGCLMNRALCRGCTVREAPGCKLRPLHCHAAALVALAALAPLFAPTARLDADARRWALPFESWNRWYDGVAVPWLHARGYETDGAAFYLPESMLVLEWRVTPLLALALATIAFGLARARREARAQQLLAVAVGLLAYAYLELILYAATRDAIVGSLGHELAELWFLLCTAELLRRAYPRAEVAPEAAS